ncbi:glycosyltransferase [Tenacibaculum sp. IB213877]|uniref:glycosyltransferase n=1 Tax=Tenacibaculum sp. IB213877 TaxID=3097351 RepID=UPI002A59DE12|nr:glycosyltransferase [Tenacibaculum sp. IB213877]MDY0780413.1 glycosyltransferase [Tenacibaculum sp. IB213877]
MDYKVEISACIVLYNEPIQELEKTINSFLNIPLSKKLFLVDNSSKNNKNFNHPDIEYIFNSKNIGFAKANNQIIEKIDGYSKYHLVLNPDVVFNPEIISKLVSKLEKEKDLAMIAPKATYLDGSHQYTARKYPSFFDLIIRRTPFFSKRKKEQEYQLQDLSKPFYPDFIHGCFMLFNTKDFVQLKGFDKRYFLYMEDVDICKKIDELEKKKLYYPLVKVQHVKRKGSAKKIKLLFYHLSSAIKYFLKWGFS